MMVIVKRNPTKCWYSCRPGENKGCFGSRHQRKRVSKNSGLGRCSCCLPSHPALGVFFVSQPPQVPALVAVKDVRDIGFLDLGTRQVHPYAALVALDHGPSRKWLPTVTGDQVPWIVSCLNRGSKEILGLQISTHWKLTKLLESSTGDTWLHHYVFICDPGLPLAGAHLCFPDGFVLLHLP